MCPLCLDTVPGEDWAGTGQGAGQVLGHRAQCCSRNTAKLSTYPAHALPCPRCGGKLRLWPAPGPASKFRCSAERGACRTSNTGSKIRNNGKNRCCRFNCRFYCRFYWRLYCRFYCYPCDYNLCGGCIEQAARERSQQEQLVSCLASLCEKVPLPTIYIAIIWLQRHSLNSLLPRNRIYLKV